MKNLQQIISVLIFTFSLVIVSAQDEGTGMPGDHFSLEGALDLFQKSKSPEHFEELLNKESNEVNNLDLNNDGQIDYIRIIDNVESDAHALIIRIPISKDEAQDIAIIAIEKTGEESATLQIIGDEEIYGEEIIIEPFDQEASSNGKGGPSADYTLTRIIINVWSWPSVRYIYSPKYRPYISPWRWAHYPNWWSPWRPLAWNRYHPRTLRWGIGFRIAPIVRVSTARRIYTPRRTTSVTVVNRYKVNKTNYKANRKTTVVRKNSTTVVKNGKGKKTVTKKSTKISTKKNERKAVEKKVQPKPKQLGPIKNRSLQRRLSRTTRRKEKLRKLKRSKKLKNENLLVFR